MILHKEASPNYGMCMGESCANNAINRDCVGGSSKSGTMNRVYTKVWPQTTPYSVVWHVCGWNQLKYTHKWDFHQILAHTGGNSENGVENIFPSTTKNTVLHNSQNHAILLSNKVMFQVCIMCLTLCH